MIIELENDLLRLTDFIISKIESPVSFMIKIKHEKLGVIKFNFYSNAQMQAFYDAITQGIINDEKVVKIDYPIRVSF